LPSRSLSALLFSACLDPPPERRESVVTQPTPTPSLTYVVESRDTLSSIAAKLGTTTEALSAANSIEDPDLISVGIELNIPDPHEPTTSPLASLDPCDGLRAVADGIGGLLAQLRSGATDFAEALRGADRLDAELQQMPRSSPAYQALQSAIKRGCCYGVVSKSRPFGRGDQRIRQGATVP
jgi:LysM repeat protein